MSDNFDEVRREIDRVLTEFVKETEDVRRRTAAILDRLVEACSKFPSPTLVERLLIERMKAARTTLDEAPDGEEVVEDVDNQLANLQESFDNDLSSALETLDDLQRRTR